jgi:hypothetical protein
MFLRSGSAGVGDGLVFIIALVRSCDFSTVSLRSVWCICRRHARGGGDQEGEHTGIRGCMRSSRAAAIAPRIRKLLMNSHEACSRRQTAKIRWLLAKLRLVIEPQAQAILICRLRRSSNEPTAVHLLILDWTKGRWAAGNAGFRHTDHRVNGTRNRASRGIDALSLTYVTRY